MVMEIKNGHFASLEGRMLQISLKNWIIPFVVWTAPKVELYQMKNPCRIGGRKYVFLA